MGCYLGYTHDRNRLPVGVYMYVNMYISMLIHTSRCSLGNCGKIIGNTGKTWKIQVKLNKVFEYEL